MANVSDVTHAPVSGYNYIDALLALAPNWNYLTTDGSHFRGVLYYSFDTAGTQYETGVQRFSDFQQAAARQILEYATTITGIPFAEVTDGNGADIRFAAANLQDTALDGACYVPYKYTNHPDGTLASYSTSAVIYLDTKQPANFSPYPGSWGYQALLHEVGHALGLKHPFDAYGGAESTLAWPQQDTTASTVMSYSQSGSYTTTFAPLDLAALQFLYGGDGLGGLWGVRSSGMRLEGSPLNDHLTAPAGRAILTDGGGVDIVHYDGQQADFRITPTADKQWLLVQDGRHETLISTTLEYIDFNGELVATAALLNPAGRIIDGNNGNDLISGTAGLDMLAGFDGDDLLVSNGGNDLIWGGHGFDTAQLMGSLQDATISRGNRPDIWLVSTRFGNCTLVDVEQALFDNGLVRLDLAGLETVNLAGLQQNGLVQYFG